ncbi:MAG TPA: hypothetical protein VL961_04480 [Acidimicrobiales bacterium]|nr:hypothetical protein [Acidimicrobiales bacterium]
MGCLLALIAWISPRFVLAMLYLFTTRLTIAFSSGWEGVLGFLFLPYATLIYALVYRPGPGVSGFGWVLVALGLLFDVSSLTAGGRLPLRRGRAGRRRRARA